MPLFLEHATSADIEKLSREQTVFFFPVGPLEDHGPHLPLCLDIDEGESLAFAIAEKLERDLAGWTGVIMPRTPLGASTNTTRFAIPVRAHVLRDWLVDACGALGKIGFKQFVCLTGNLTPRNLTAIEEAGKLVRKNGRSGITRYLPLWLAPGRGPTLSSASSALVTRDVASRSPFWPDPLEHGGERDTAIALSIVPEYVKPSWNTLEPVARPLSRGARWKERSSQTLAGYWGRPADATAEKGQFTLREELGEIYPKLRAVWQGSDPRKIFKTLYASLPPNGSFFQAWILAVALAMLMLAWTLISFDAMTQ